MTRNLKKVELKRTPTTTSTSLTDAPAEADADDDDDDFVGLVAPVKNHRLRRRKPIFFVFSSSEGCFGRLLPTCTCPTLTPTPTSRFTDATVQFRRFRVLLFFSLSFSFNLNFFQQSEDLNERSVKTLKHAIDVDVVVQVDIDAATLGIGELFLCVILVRRLLLPLGQFCSVLIGAGPTRTKITFA